MTFGPAAPGPLALTIDGRPFTLVVPDGQTLADIAVSGQWPRLLPGLLDEDSRDLLTARIRTPYDPMTWHAVFRIVLGLAPELYGVEWWAAQRLCALARERWRDWSAWCVRRGLDVDTASGHRIVSAVWAWLMDHAQEQKDIVRLERDIFDPPPELRRTQAAVPRGFSQAELEAQSRQIAAMAGPGDDGE
ncbi:hypothetical protein [Streptomyces olivaceus]|uniref:hypothetical protein n=1 Tax=Streptomyces olivaceus TaxID=47716 RepID=UPI0022EFA025|nr:hypothetical protein [Streptomyces olivaceus]GHI91749.1 hypothetical protein TPA0905_12200 [Streptomyces olivaceus]